MKRLTPKKGSNKKDKDTAFIVLFQNDADIARGREIANAIAELESVAGVEVSDEKYRRLKVMATSVRARFSLMSKVKEIPGVEETELITYYKTC